MEESMFTQIIQAFQQGGTFMYPIAFLFFAALAIVVERTYFLYFRYGIDADRFMNKIEDLVKKDQCDQAIKFCNQASTSLLPRVVKSGLERSSRDMSQVNQAIEVSTMDAISVLRNRTGYLSMVANVATLVGLLGTIVGLISAFEAVAHADPQHKQTMLASGISVAMNTTAFGLIVAIPSMMFFSFLQNRTNKIIDQIDKASTRVVDVLSSRVYREFELGSTPAPASAPKSEQKPETKKVA
jgi:biopolymer transport protein ExbB/TolQ